MGEPLFVVGLRVYQGGSYGLGRGLALTRVFGASISADGESSEPSPEGSHGRAVEPAGCCLGGVSVGLSGRGVVPAGAQVGGGLAGRLEHLLIIIREGAPHKQAKS